MRVGNFWGEISVVYIDKSGRKNGSKLSIELATYVKFGVRELSETKASCTNPLPEVKFMRKKLMDQGLFEARMRG